MARSAKLALLALVVAFAAAHVAAVFTESINWDEFVLFHRAERTIATGELDGGGRPGLGVLALVPFVHDCATTIGTIDAARVVWAAITFALFAGFFVWLRDATRRSARSWHAAALGTALVALVPAVVRWSIHVRTDNPALACAMWGAVALLASRRRALLAIAGGALIGAGYLCSQKALYVGALGGLVALGNLFIEGKLVARRDATRLAGAIAGAIAVLGAYKLIVPRFYVPPVVSIEGGLDTFEFYRRVMGFRVYAGMLPTLVPQLALVGLVVAAAVRAGRRGSTEARPLLVALAVLVLGVVVGQFHAAAFPYFWMTLGLFPAAAIAIGWAGIVELLPRAHKLVAIAAWGSLVAIAVPRVLSTLAPTQQIQRDTFAFIDRDLPPPLRGFQVEGGLFCRRDPAPLPAYLGQSMMRFSAAGGAELAAQLVEAFRDRPIAFLVHSHRFDYFPATVATFWATHYVPYREAVELAGWRITPARHDVDAIVAARYRWLGNGRVTIDGTTLDRDQTIMLATGAHAVSATGDGILVLAVDDPPAPSTTPFHSEAALLEFMGL